MSIRIIHPGGLTGPAAGLQFEGGVAVASSLSKDARAVLGEHGYKFENVKDEPTEAEKKAAAEKVEAAKAAAENVTGEKIDQAKIEGEPAAIVELADGSVVGDGENLVTLHEDGTATVDGASPEGEPAADAAPAEKPEKAPKK